MRRIYGFTSETGTLETFLQAVHPDDLQRVQSTIEAALEDGKPFELDFRICVGDAVRYIHSETEVYPGKDGKPVRLFGTAQDITRQKLIEEQLRTALLEAGRFRQAMEHVPAYVYMKDLQSRYTYANRRTLELFGCSADALVGKDDSSFFPPETAKRLREVDLRVFAGHQTSEEIDVADAGSGRRVYLEVKTPIYEGAENPTITGLLGISTDITGRKQAEEALNDAKAQAELYLDLMGHDINNLNQSALGYLELALQTLEADGKLGPDGRVLIDKPLQAIGTVRS